jgi:hypothetical protein
MHSSTKSSKVRSSRSDLGNFGKKLNSMKGLPDGVNEATPRQCSLTQNPTIFKPQLFFRFIPIKRMTATDQSVGRGKVVPCPYRMCRIFNSNWYQRSAVSSQQSVRSQLHPLAFIPHPFPFPLIPFTFCPIPFTFHFPPSALSSNFLATDKTDIPDSASRTLLWDGIPQ